MVAADSGSIYEPHPTLSYEWDPDFRTTSLRTPPPPRQRGPSVSSRKSPTNGSGFSNLPTPPSFNLGPHPADPHSTVLPTSPTASQFSPSSAFGNVLGMPNGRNLGPNASKEVVTGQELWVYGGQGG